MNLQNEMRRQKKINFEFKAKRLRLEIESLAKTICINMDTGLNPPEEIAVEIIDSQWDQLKDKWAQLTVALSEIKRLEEELK